jgi:hypothetical protein
MSTLAATNLKHESSASNNITLTSAGNVGIGTSSPAGYGKLAVASSGSTGIGIQGNGQTVLSFFNAAGSLQYTLGRSLSSDNAQNFFLYDNAATATRLFIDSSGNVGIGTSSPAGKLDILTGTYRGYFDDAAGSLFRLNGVNAANSAYGPMSLNGSILTFQTDASERMRIDSSGNVGIGTSSPNGKLGVSDGTVQIITAPYGAGLTGYFGTYTNHALAFITNNTERMRIDSSGNFVVGSTSSTVAGKNAKITAYQTASSPSITSYNNTTATTNQIIFVNPNGEVGNINTGGTVTSYNTSSDYRLKHDVQPLVGALANVVALKPVIYKWNADNSHGEGFIAHELQAVIPQAVSGEKDAVNDDGSIKPQGVDYSKVVVHLVAAIQELSAKVAALEAKQ